VVSRPRIFRRSGTSLEKLAAVADEVLGVIWKVPGSQDAQAEQVTGLPFIQIVPDRFH